MRRLRKWPVRRLSSPASPHFPPPVRPPPPPKPPRAAHAAQRAPVRSAVPPTKASDAVYRAPNMLGSTARKPAGPAPVPASSARSVPPWGRSQVWPLAGAESRSGVSSGAHGRAALESIGENASSTSAKAQGGQSVAQRGSRFSLLRGIAYGVGGAVVIGSVLEFTPAGDDPRVQEVLRTAHVWTTLARSSALSGLDLYLAQTYGDRAAIDQAEERAARRLLEAARVSPVLAHALLAWRQAHSENPVAEHRRAAELLNNSSMMEALEQLAEHRAVHAVDSATDGKAANVQRLHCSFASPAAATCELRVADEHDGSADIRIFVRHMSESAVRADSARALWALEIFGRFALGSHAAIREAGSVALDTAQRDLLAWLDVPSAERARKLVSPCGDRIRVCGDLPALRSASSAAMLCALGEPLETASMHERLRVATLLSNLLLEHSIIVGSPAEQKLCVATDGGQAGLLVSLSNPEAVHAVPSEYADAYARLWCAAFLADLSAARTHARSLGLPEEDIDELCAAVQRRVNVTEAFAKISQRYKNEDPPDMLRPFLFAEWLAQSFSSQELRVVDESLAWRAARHLFDMRWSQGNISVGGRMQRSLEWLNLRIWFSLARYRRGNLRSVRPFPSTAVQAGMA